MFRAFWVDGFGPGLFTEPQIAQLVADAKAANLNAIVAQVGRRGDCFCNRAAMPRTEAGIAEPPFDPLQTLIEMAHAHGLEVHAWINATAIWNSPTPPRDPMHVFNTHGPSQSGEENWLMLRSDGALRGGADVYLDPGHPAAAEYILKMCTSIVANYQVAGINLDMIRYPDYNLGPNVPSWGYNPVSVARFQAAMGRTDVPGPTDPLWAQWRRDQITNLVRKVYLETYALNPRIRVSADTIVYAFGPQSQGGWEQTRTYAEVLQDWRAWMEEGILDLNIPMNYKAEHLVAEPGNQQRMFAEWNEFIKDHQYDRQAAIGSALYLNSIDGTEAQVRKALAPSTAGYYARGWVGFAYRSPDSQAAQRARTDDESRAELTRVLAAPGETSPFQPPIFTHAVPVPEMTWKTQATTGHLRGTVTTVRGEPLDQVRVDVVEADTVRVIRSRRTDGSGWFGFVDLPPGRYRVAGTPDHGPEVRSGVVSVLAGQLATVAIEASSPLDP